ncbi:MAG TPA: hypothetical protein PLB26_17165 [Rubrivivax sp.]|nr:hypothetical protein [Rubrivivax sp.]
MTTLIAERAFFYAGRTRRKGEVFEAAPAHARLLVRTRQAKAQEPTAEPVPADEPVAARSRRQYRRRDLRAEG